MEEKNKTRPIPLCEILVKTYFYTQTTSSEDKTCENPINYGSGFIVRYEDRSFFVTADHVLHPEDHDIKERTGIDNIVSIFNNIRPKENYLSTIITPLGGFYYGELFNISKPKDAPALVDVSVCLMKPINFQYPFHTDEVRFQGLTINAGEEKWPILQEAFSEPDKDSIYVYIWQNTVKDCQRHTSGTLRYIERRDFILRNGRGLLPSKYA